MCGIAGILSFNNSVPFQNIKIMTQAMRHRGPDDEGFAFFNSKNHKYNIFGGVDTPINVFKSSLSFTPNNQFGGNLPPDTILAFGHRRLSIIDLSPAGHQPMCTKDGRYWIVYNGEIYNFKEIRSEISKHGENFVSNTDTEVILKAYRLWGSECLKKFNGMWAFVIWDNKKKVLFCSRDRIGIKPFYYYLTNDFFLFASDIKTLIASNIYKPEPNWEGVYHAMSLQCAPRPMTCFKGVKALEQAHWMTIDLRKSIQKERYWRIPVGEIDCNKTEDQWKDELEYTLRQAVKRRLVADVPVGTFMSGGIDSTTVSAIAATLHPGIKAFTLGHAKDAAELDELPQASATASMYDMEHIFEKSNSNEVLEHLDEIVNCYEEPFPSLGPIYFISSLVNKYNTTVVLNGLGPDEMFCGYGRERWLQLWKKVSFLRKAFRSMLQKGNIGKLNRILGSRDIIDYYINVFSPFTDQEKRSLFSDDIAKGWDTYTLFKEVYRLKQFDFSGDIEALTYLDILNYIGNHHVYRIDQFTMHFSLESRFPFLDHELIELSCKMPASIKVINGVGKSIMRHVAGKYIDSSCLSMTKKGFVMPMDQWMRTKIGPLIEDKLVALKTRGIFENAKLDILSTRFNKYNDFYLKLWLPVSIELWLEAFFD